MSATIGTVSQHNAPSKQAKGYGRLPPGHRALYAHVPEQVFNHAKAQALLSGMRFNTEYLIRLLAEAKPYRVSRRPNEK